MSPTAEWLRHVCQLCPHDTLRHDGLGSCRVSCKDCRAKWCASDPWFQRRMDQA